MGFNSTIVIMNDCLGQIERDEHFGKKVASAVAEHWGCDRDGKRYVDFAHGSKVIAQHHADVITVLMVGGNMGLCVGFGRNGGRCHKPEHQIEILKDVAESFGYKLIRMSEKEKKKKPWLKPYDGSGCFL